MINDHYRQKNVKTQMTKESKTINNKRSLNYFKKQQ